MPDASYTEPAPFHLRRHRPFLLLWLAQGFDSMAGQIVTVALGWQVYDLTRRPLDLGLIGLAQFVPALLLALPAGHAVDRYSRRTILMLCGALNAAVLAALCLGSISGVITLPEIYALAALLGVSRSFEWPAGSALMAGIVPRHALGSALAWNSSLSETATIIGPALGGFLYALGPGAAYGACTLVYTGGFLLMSALPRPAKIVHDEAATLRSVFAGVGFILKRKIILGSISLDLFAVLLGGATALLPVYARDILMTGPIGLGLLRAAPAVGALLVAGALARYPLTRRVGPVLFVTVAIFGVATCVFAVSQSFPVSLAALAVLGASDMVSVYVRHVLVQLGTPDGMRGRVSAVESIFIGTSNQLGEFESGVTAALLGTVNAVLLGGIGTLVVVGLWALCFPQLRRADRIDEEAAEPA
jgi:MFS family permease